MKSLFLTFSTLAVLALTEGLTNYEILQHGNNQFTAKMFSEIVKENKGKSIALSAFSVITPLAQLALASEGASHDELLNAIGIPDDDTTIAVLTLIKNKLSSVKGVELKRASHLYIPMGYEVHSAFAAAARDVYDSPISNVKFSDNINTAKDINAWVEEQTNHRIKDLVDPGSLNSDTRAVLVNALYFKGSWKYPFNNLATVNQDFYVNKEDTIKVPMMYNKEQYKYKESDRLNSKILELPYRGDESSFLIVLPNDKDGIEELLEQLKNPNVLDEEIEGAFFTEVRVRIPKFKIETTTDLKKVLENMNIKQIFGDNANITKLLKTDERLKVTDAVQKVFIEINEEGAEAAAANVFGIVGASLVLGPVFEFNANHPFVFFLKANDETLFNGVYYAFLVAEVASLSLRPIFSFIADHPFAFFLKANNDILFNGVFYGL